MGAKQTYGAKGRGDVLNFDPEDIVLVEDKGHALYDERVHLPINERLVRNIMVHGVLQAIGIVRDGDKVLCAFGRQRVKAAREANRRLIKEGSDPINVPAVWKRAEEGDLIGMVISENEQRENDTPMVRARKLQRYLDKGKSDAQAMDMFGVSNVTIKNWKDLLDCAAVVQKAVEDGQVSAEVATVLVSLSHADQGTKLAEMIASGATKGEKGKRAARQAAGKPVAAKVRSRKEIQAMLDAMNEVGDGLPDVRKFARWVLGEEGILPKKWSKMVEGEAKSSDAE